MNLNWDSESALVKRQAMREGMTIESTDWLAWREPLKKIEEEEAAAKRERRKNAKAGMENPEFQSAIEASLALAGGTTMIASGSGKGKRKLDEGDEKSVEMKENRSGSSGKRSEAMDEDLAENRQKGKSKSKSVEKESIIIIDDNDDSTSSPAKPSSAHVATPKLVALLANRNPPSSGSTAPRSDPANEKSTTPRHAPPRSISVPARSALMDIDESSQSTSASIILPSNPPAAESLPRSQSSPPPTPAPFRSKHFSPTLAISSRSLLNPLPPPPPPPPLVFNNPVLTNERYPILAKTIVISSKGTLAEKTEEESQISQSGSTSDEEEPISRRAVKKQRVEPVETESPKFEIRGTADSSRRHSTIYGAAGTPRRSSLTKEDESNKPGSFQGLSIAGGAAKSRGSLPVAEATELSIKGMGSQEDDEVLIIDSVVGGSGKAEVEEAVLQDGQGKTRGRATR